MCLLAGSLADAMPTPSMRSRLCSRRVFAVAAHPAVADGPLQARFLRWRVRPGVVRGSREAGAERCHQLVERDPDSAVIPRR